MRGSSRASLPRRERLRRRAEFQSLFRRGLRSEGSLLLLLAAPNRLSFSRLGLAVGRRVGGAVQRNRVKRLLRECFRRLKPEAPGLDLLLVAKPQIQARGAQEVEREYRERIAQVGRRSRARAGSGASSRPD